MTRQASASYENNAVTLGSEIGLGIINLISQKLVYLTL